MKNIFIVLAVFAFFGGFLGCASTSAYEITEDGYQKIPYNELKPLYEYNSGTKIMVTTADLNFSNGKELYMGTNRITKKLSNLQIESGKSYTLYLTVKNNYPINGAGSWSISPYAKEKNYFYMDRIEGPLLSIEDQSLTFPDGSRYVGQFKDGKRDGQGTMTWADGSKYAGQWKDDKPHGHGTMYTSSGAIYQKGIFENGKFIGESNEKPAEASENILGKFIGTIGGFEGGDVVVNGRDTIGVQASIGRALIVDANGQHIYLESVFPMQTVVKCKVTSGDRAKIKKGMKVYLKP